MDLAEAFQPGESLVQEHRQWKSKSKHKSTGAGYKSHTFNDEADDSEPQKENLVQKPPCTILEAVRRKYKYKKPVGEDAGELVDEKILAHTGAKQELHLLTRVFIHDEHVVSAGEEGELGAACGAIEELDLEGNELQAWASIVTIAAQLPKLHWLGLNRLRLEPLGAALPEGFGSALGRLRSLCLSATGMTWAQLLMLAEATPELQELHFNGNAVSGFQPSEEGAALPLQRLQTLCVEDNELTSWEALAPLAALPHLEFLNLNGNAIASVPKVDGFTALKVILLRANPIAEWPSIDHLNALPSLSEARLSELPLLSDMSAAASRRLLIGRLGGLKVLNGGEVKPRSRDDAERFYLRQIHAELPEGGLPPALVASLPSDETKMRTAAAYNEAHPVAIKDVELGPDRHEIQFAKEQAEDGAARQLAESLAVPQTDAWLTLEASHPRWRVLLVKHGEQRAAGPGGGGAGSTLAAELIDLTLRSTAADSAHIGAQTKRLPNGLPLKSVKMIACTIFKLEPTKQQLLYLPPGDEKQDIPEPLDDDAKSLADLGVETGGTIVVEELQE